MLKKIFFETKMTWKRVIILSVLCGIIPGILMIPSFLSSTSFQQPGISYEFWIFMAMHIILNCESAKEAGYKTFIFFLISQPLIYLVQVPFYYEHWRIFTYYPTWGILTLFTLPGGMIAWYTKKNKWYSIPILMVACAILAYELPNFAFSCYRNFPKMSLATLFVLGELIVFPFLLFEKKSYRIITLACIGLLLIASFQREYQLNMQNNASYSFHLNVEGPYTLVEDGEIFDIEFIQDIMVVNYNEYKLNKVGMEGQEFVTFIDGKGKEHQYTIEYHYGVVDLKED